MKRTRVKIITTSNTKIESSINEFINKIENDPKIINVDIKSVDVREGNGNNIATILYTYDEN